MLINETNFAQMGELLTSVLLENRELKNEIAALKNDRGYSELTAEVTALKQAIGTIAEGLDKVGNDLGARTTAVENRMQSLCHETLPQYVKSLIDQSNSKGLLSNFGTKAAEIEVTLDPK